MLSGILKSPHSYILTLWLVLLLFFNGDRKTKENSLHCVRAVVEKDSSKEQDSFPVKKVVEAPVLTKRVVKNSEVRHPTGDINTMSVEELVKIKGVGEVLASRIVAFRQERGAIKDLKELLDVKGIGPSKLHNIQLYCRGE